MMVVASWRWYSIQSFNCCHLKCCCRFLFLWGLADCTMLVQKRSCSKVLFEYLSPILPLEQVDYFVNCAINRNSVKLSARIFPICVVQFGMLVEDQGDCWSQEVYLNVVIYTWPRLFSMVKKVTWDECVAVGEVVSKVSLECFLLVVHILNCTIAP